MQLFKMSIVTKRLGGGVISIVVFIKSNTLVRVSRVNGLRVGNYEKLGDDARKSMEALSPDKIKCLWEPLISLR